MATSASHVIDAGAVHIEWPAKAYQSGVQSGYTTPYELDNPCNIPASNLDDRLSKLDGARSVGDTSARSDQGQHDDHASRGQNLTSWVVKNQKFLACLWSIGASGWSDACLVSKLTLCETGEGSMLTIFYRVLCCLSFKITTISATRRHPYCS